MAYVDLNPVRSDMAQSLEFSGFTSIYERIHSVASQQDKGKGELASLPAKDLAGFLGHVREEQPCFGVEFTLLDSGSIRTSRTVKQASQIRLLERLDMNAEEWLKLSECFGSKFRCVVGSTKELANYALYTTCKLRVAYKQSLGIRKNVNANKSMRFC
ncbi:hypothetical protein [Vibrio mediterranei]|uniref:hypothetical protein n=1 Tax=Vibrio mediterranei TaxID=689 RepID=UPI0007857DFE|nr:hypothetical protein [Vibrio mediterranei]